MTVSAPHAPSVGCPTEGNPWCGKETMEQLPPLASGLAPSAEPRHDTTETATDAGVSAPLSAPLADLPCDPWAEYWGPAHSTNARRHARVVTQKVPRRTTWQSTEPHLYFAQDEETGHVKIGVSRDVAQRMAGLAPVGRSSVVLLGMVKRGAPLEPFLHRAFATHSIGGEWFLPAPDLLELAAAPSWRAALEVMAHHEDRFRESHKALCALLSAPTARHYEKCAPGPTGEAQEQDRDAVRHAALVRDTVNTAACTANVPCPAQPARLSCGGSAWP